MKKSIAVLGLMFCSVGMADENTWKLVASSIDGEYSWYFKKHSCGATLGHKNIISCIEKRDDNKTSSFYRIATTIESCKAGFGKITVLTLNWEKIVTTYDVVADGGTLSSGEFEYLCLPYLMK